MEAEHSANSNGARVSVELRDSDRTRPMYPFGFVVRAAYELAAGRLTITYTVAAAGSNSGPMPFSVGNHMSFRLPFLKGTEPAAMLFETPSGVQLLRDAKGLLNGEQRPRSFASPMKLGDFDAKVALPLAGYRVRVFARITDPKGLSLLITQKAPAELPEPVVRFNVFGGPAQGFFCPEPWFGVQNSLNLKKGLVTLDPGAEWRWVLDLTPETGVNSGT